VNTCEKFLKKYQIKIHKKRKILCSRTIEVSLLFDVSREMTKKKGLEHKKNPLKAS
jgi:hypothetical protein